VASRISDRRVNFMDMVNIVVISVLRRRGHAKRRDLVVALLSGKIGEVK